MDALEALYNDINIIPTAEQQKKLELKMRRGNQLLGHCNIALLHANEVAMDYSLEKYNWRAALEYGKKLDKLYLFYLSKYHPTHGLHYFKQGILKLNCHLLFNTFLKSTKPLCIL